MTTAIDFTKPARLLKTSPGMYRHDGDRSFGCRSTDRGAKSLG